jgi:UDP-GlcNAc:undecaprenyl-phosphate GlcNAc-1-phosphate transferase
MQLDHFKIELALLAAGLIYSAFVVVFSNKIAAFLGVMDHPGAQAHKSHSAPTPLVGGLAAIPPAVVILLVGFRTSAESPQNAAAYLALAFATLASMLVGFFDDRRHIPALTRLIICGFVFFCAAKISPDFVVSALDFQGIGLRFDLGLLAVPFSVLCLLAFQNAVNMADGRDGLVAGIAVIWLFNLLSYGWHPITFALAAMLVGMLIVLGANLGGMLFLGDAGTYGLGAFVGLSAIWLHQLNLGLYTIEVAIMFMVPVLDMARLFVFRLLARRHPFSADHHHLHHYLDRSIGWMWGRKIYYGLVGVPILVVRAQWLQPVSALGLGVALYVAAIVYGRMRGRLEAT